MMDPSAPSPAPARLETEAERIDRAILGRDRSTNPFVSAVRATRMPMIITNPRLPDNPVVFANDAFCRLTGYERVEILGHNCRFLQGPQTDPATVRRIRAAVDAVEALEIDIRNHRKDGTPFWNRLLLAPVRDEAGALAFFFASQVDVTLERERLAGLESHNAALLAELNDRLRALEDSEARLRFATEAGRLGIWEMDVASGAMTASAICRELFGQPANQHFDYAALCARVHQDDRERLRAGFDACLRSGGEFAEELRIQHPDGRLAWADLRAQVLRAPDGAPLRLAGTSLDITARRREQQRARALLTLNDRFRVLEQPDDLAYAAAETLGVTLGISRAGYGTIVVETEIFEGARDWSAPGVAPLAVSLQFRDFGSYIEDLKRGETVVIADATRDPRTAATAAQLQAIQARAFINMPVSEQDGPVALLYLSHAEPRTWTDEELDFVREVAERTRMAVERRRAELDLRDLAASLESQVAARTRELMETEAALRQSQKMEAVGQLTGGLAHDFNNLLTGITGSLELMKARVAQGRLADVDRYLSAAQAAANRAAALTHRLLAFSRRQTLEPKPTDVNRLVAGLEELIRRTVGPSVTVETIGAAGLWNTLVDPSQLENALLNLCINARDAMPDGGKLTIETSNRWLDERAARSRELPAGQYVALCVSDTGTGMTQDVIAKAFDPFFTTKPLGQGTGLGLSMIYGFARQSGGQARIYSEVGKGTMVCLYLPRHVGPADEPDAPEATRPSRPSGHGETVLVVDDEPSVRMLVTDVLDDLGYHAIEAEDGAAGMRVLQSAARVDLVVTDVGLPHGMNGRQMADAGRALRPALKVLFITGYAENAVLSHGHLDPGMHVLTKPFAMETLANRIKDLLRV